MKDRASVVNNWIESNKASEVAKAKTKAADQLKNLSDSEKLALTHLKAAVDKVGVKGTYQLLQIINLSES